MLNDLASRALRAVVGVMGEPVTFRRGQVSYPIKGVYQASYVGLDPETGVQVRSAQPVLLLNRQDVAVEPRQGDQVEVRDGLFRVRSAQPDGHTGWLLLLQGPIPVTVNVYEPGVFEAGVFA